MGAYYTSGAEWGMATRSYPSLTFKVAGSEEELEQICRLNYATFVEEIPQHDPNPQGKLEDLYHKENTYVICLDGDRVVGMVAVRGKRPFSLDRKLENLDAYLPPAKAVCEIRLLSVDSRYRNGRVFVGLVRTLAQHCLRLGYDLGLISGTLRQQKLYRHLGFVPFGPVVGSGDALFQPMYLTLDTFLKKTQPLIHAEFPETVFLSQSKKPLNLLPGPVNIDPMVEEALAGPPVSHRAQRFLQHVAETKRLLCRLVNASRVEILLGSGTFANDAVAGQLSVGGGAGVVLSNGEFGERLINHAKRFRLAFEVVRQEWGAPFTQEGLRQVLDRYISGERPPAWLWAVHCETSTGVLNDLDMLKKVCAERGLRLCVDCISSIGTVPVDLAGVYFASCASGKALGAFPGLSMVFYDHDLLPAPESLPRSLDLGLYSQKQGVPFTTSSNLFYALRTALEYFEPEEVYRRIVMVSQWLRGRLGELGFRLVAPEAHASPAVITIALPKTVSSEEMGDQLEKAGYLLSYRSEYLIERNWIQVYLMGKCAQDAIAPLLEELRAFAPALRAG